MSCMLYKLCGPPLEVAKNLMVPISMPPNDSHLRSVGLERGDFACAAA
jgi:hypothetical protein